MNMPSASLGTQCRFIYLKPPDYVWDLPALQEEISQGGLIFLCNPNNPTGTLLSRSSLEAVLEALPASALLVMDEAFIDFVADHRDLTLVPRAVQDSRLLVLGSLTKFFALPGLRLGYLVGTPDNIQKLAAFLPPWNINSLAQAAGAAALGDATYIRHSRDYIFQARQLLFEILTAPSPALILCRPRPTSSSAGWARGCPTPPAWWRSWASRVSCSGTAPITGVWTTAACAWRCVAARTI